MIGPLPKIHEYPDFPAYLASYVAQRRAVQPWFSARWIMRRIGLQSPSPLSMLMARRRAPSLELVHRVCEALSLTPDEVRFGVLLTERELQRSPVLVDLVERELRSIADRNGWRVVFN